MKSRHEIIVRGRSLIYEYMRSSVTSNSLRLPENCRHNLQAACDDPEPKNRDRVRITRSGKSTIGLCMYGAESPQTWPGNICDDPTDACSCPLFSSLRTDQEVIEACKSNLRNPEWVQENIPELATILWVLQLSEIRLSWIERLKLWLARKPLESMQPAPILPDVDQLVYYDDNMA